MNANGPNEYYRLRKDSFSGIIFEDIEYNAYPVKPELKGRYSFISRPRRQLGVAFFREGLKYYGGGGADIEFKLKFLCVIISSLLRLMFPSV